MLTSCPHCGTPVVPTPEEKCPSCGQRFQDSPSLAPSQGSDQAWEQYLAAQSGSPWMQELAAFYQTEQPWIDQRLEHLQSIANPSDEDRHWAERLDQELIQDGQALLERLSQMEVSGNEHEEKLGVEAYLQARLNCWILLREAIRQQSTTLAEQHAEVWDSTEQIMLGLNGESGPGYKNPAQAAAEFQAALVSFTPRLMVLPVIIAINVLVFVWMVIQGVSPISPSAEAVLEWGANFGPKTMNGEWWRLVTCMFLHFGIIHLAFNMWVLWDVGQLVERLVGNAGFFVLYMLSGLLGSLASLLRHSSGIVSAGASGAVFGVCGALVGFLAFRRDTIPKETLAHLKGSMTAFLGYNLVFGMMIPNIDMAAHVGGLIGGLICGAILSQPLSREMLPRRMLRNVMATFAGAAACGAAFAMLPEAPTDVQAVGKQVDEMEQATIKKFADAASRYEAGNLSDADFAKELETQILPEWKQMRGLLREMEQQQNVDRTVLANLDTYFGLRQESWELLLRYLKEPNEELFQQFLQKRDAADNRLQQFQQEKPK